MGLVRPICVIFIDQSEQSPPQSQALMLRQDHPYTVLIALSMAWSPLSR